MRGSILRGTGKRPVPLRLDALLFDLDGTLVDTTELHVNATNAALATFGRKISRPDYEAHLHGGANDDTRHFLFPDDPQGKGRDYVALKEQLFRESVVQLERMPGLTALLDWAAEHSLKTAVVTNAPRANADLMLRAIGLADRFDAIAGAGDPTPLMGADLLIDDFWSPSLQSLRHAILMLESS